LDRLSTFSTLVKIATAFFFVQNSGLDKFFAKGCGLCGKVGKVGAVRALFEIALKGTKNFLKRD
jgi:hypothetical protein